MLVTPGLADDISLIRVGESWRHYRGTNEPSAPVTAWRQLVFDDSGWQEGASGFSTTAYSSTREATFWSQSPPSILSRSFYLRRAFSVADPQAVKWLILRLDYDDGFVAYLNGQEVLRRGLANDPAAHDDYADYHFGGTAEEFDISSFAGLLTVGENVLAIQVHTAVTNAPGYDHSIRLVPELLANFQRGPLVANASTNSIQVIWRTPVASDSVVEFGTSQAMVDSASDFTLTTNHVVTLTNLLAGTEYFYRVRSAAGGISAVSPTLSFHTFKPSGDFTFLVIGDSEDGTLAKYRVARSMEQSPADLAVHCGDLMYDYFILGREDYRCLSVYGPQMRSMPFYFSMGDHDINPTYLDQPFFQTFYLPTNPVTGTGHFYSFDHGDAHFTVLFLPTLQDLPGLEPYQLIEGSPQYCWLTNDLATSSKPWKFLFMHLTFASSGYHSIDDEDNDGIPDNLELQELLLPICQRYGVQIVFCGHEHDYERSNPMDGVYHIVTGGGGGLQPDYYFIDGRDPANCQFYLTSEFVRVAVHGDSLLLQAIGTNGAVFDYMTIQRALPPPQTYTATWHTPLVESAPADDGYGNINGQTFDFIGTPIPTLAGDSSNLGRLYVNNDATNLFIGFEQTMIYSNQTVYLFIEAPALVGVTNLVGLGDGQVGTAEGVDGLDLLENLSFTNFAPSVACLLGDEYADGQDRYFVRSGLDLKMGQGVFRLNTNFSNVSGIRLQQFNRSPQLLLPPRQLQSPEQNANFIEVAIPFDQLGGLRPGDTIRLAAVVGLAGYDTNAQTRELDTSFLGSSLTGSGQSNVVLGAISLRLAPAVLTVTADNQVRGYGATNAPLAVSYSGFLYGDDASVLSGSPGVSTMAETNSPIGIYPIELSAGTLSNANYSFSFIGGTLTVTQAMLSFTADEASRPYGAANPVFNGVMVGIVNGDPIGVRYETAAGVSSPVGSYAIVPVLSGERLGNYAVTTHYGTLTVTRAPLTVSAEGQVRAYGGTNGPLRLAYSGFVNGQDTNILSGSAELCTTAQTNSPVGVYPIVVNPGTLSVADTNYSLGFEHGTLTVTQAVLAVKAGDQVRGYGATNAPLTLTYSGFVNGQGTSILSGSAGLSTAAGPNSPVGVYAITVEPGTLSVADTNYSLGFVEGTLAVTQAVLSVTVDNRMRQYGATNPPFTGTIVGIQNEDAITADYRTAAGPASPVGNYDIVPVLSGVALSNYLVVTNTGTLAISPAALSATADNQVRGYGATNGPLTVTYSGFGNEEDPRVLSGNPLLSTAAETNSPMGAYPIEVSAGTLGNPNYSFSFTNGTLTVTQAVLTVKADDQVRGYGATNGPLTVTYSGFVNGQGTNILSGSAELSTAADTNSPVSVYAITVSPGTLSVADTNYSLAFAAGTLTITAASSSSLLASSLNPSANGGNVTFTATVSPVAPATTTPTGSVRFLQNGMELGGAELSAGVASLTTVLWAVGTNEVRAEYAGDSNFLGSSNSLQQVVTAPCSGTNYVLSLVALKTNTLRFAFLGTTNAQYYVLEATNLTADMANWTVLLDSTNTATNGVWHYDVTNAGALGYDPTNQVMRFYRARAVNPCP